MSETKVKRPRVKRIDGRPAACGKEEICRRLPFSVRTLTRHIEEHGANSSDELLAILHEDPATGQLFAFVADLRDYVRKIPTLAAKAKASRRRSRSRAS